MEHKVRYPESTIDTILDLVHHKLLSASKFADSDYISIYYGYEVNIYDGHTAKIKISEAEVLKGWH